MALIKCKECRTEVSSKAEKCPKCGAPVVTKRFGGGTLVGVVFLGIIIVSVLPILGSGTGSSTASPSQNSSSVSLSQGELESPPKTPISPWSYHHTEDEMAKGTIHEAQVSSSNTVNFGFPYDGLQHATLTLRTHPRFGKDVIFQIQKGQFLCRSYQACTVLVRFDDEQAIKLSGYGPDDNSTETIFIQNYGKFVEKMLKAKRVRIAANIYQEGAPTFEFDVTGFDQSKYRAKMPLHS